MLRLASGRLDTEYGRRLLGRSAPCRLRWAAECRVGGPPPPKVLVSKQKRQSDCCLCSSRADRMATRRKDPCLRKPNYGSRRSISIMEHRNTTLISRRWQAFDWCGAVYALLVSRIRV